MSTPSTPMSSQTVSIVTAHYARRLPVPPPPPIMSPLQPVRSPYHLPTSQATTGNDAKSNLSYQSSTETITSFPEKFDFSDAQSGDLEKALPSQSAEPAEPTQPSVAVAKNTKDLWVLPIPKRLQYDSERPFKFGMAMNIAFAVAITLVVGNLYYCQPLLIQLAAAFGVSESSISNVPTLTQIGYATGLLLISPLGDLVRRRQLVLIVVALSTVLTTLMAITSSVTVFKVLSFFLGVVSVAPQVLIPLAADLAPASKRGTAVSIVFTGLFIGILLARVLAGVIGSFTTYRAVYWMATGFQILVLIGGYLIIPDYPKKNEGLTYWGILLSMAKLAVTEPLLIQSCLIMMASSIQFSGFWVTLTFLLGGPLYKFSTLVIGLFGLVGLVGVAIGPLLGRLIDKLVLWYAVLLATFGLMLVQVIYIGAAGSTVAAVVVVCIGLSAFIDMQQIALSTSVFTINATARARLNAVFIICIFLGQAIGTSVGTSIFLSHGFRGNGFLSLNLCAVQIVLLVVRGPHVPLKKWFGWEGGAAFFRQESKAANDGQTQGGEEDEMGVKLVVEKKIRDDDEKSILPDLRA